MSAIESNSLPALTPENLTWPQPENKPQMYRNMAGFAAFGCAVRAYQLGIHKRPYLSSPRSYAISAVAYAGVGWGVYHIVRRQNYLIARMTKDIADRTSHEKISHDEAASQGSALPAGL